MANEIYQFSPTGNMDKDSDPRSIGKGDGRQGDYIDSRNTQVVSDQGGDGSAITPTLGNKFGFSLGEVSAQNKKYRVTVDGDATKSHQLRFLSTDRSVNIVTGTGPNGEVEFDGTAASLVAAVNAAMLPSLLSITTSGNEVEFELNPYSYYQWYLESVGTDDVQIDCTQEAIPVDLAGKLKDIGSYDLLGDLFVFSTTQDNEPQETDLEIVGVGPVSGGQFVGPVTEITFTSNHNLQIGQWIRITGSEQSWQNGTFVIHSIPNATTIGIVTNTAWGQSYPTGISGPNTTITLNPNGIGEIGVAVKDENEDNWTYTRLLRSVELNFVSKKAIRTDSRVKGKRKITYYTDKYNVPRDFVYIGEFSQDGALNINNPLNQYRYDSIGIQSSLLENSLSSINTRIEYVGQSDSGGELISGNKYYVFRFKDQEGSTTTWSDPTRAIPVFPRSLVDDDPVTIKGGSPSDNPTTKVVNLTLEDIPQGIFESVQVGVLDSDDSGALSGTIFNDIDLTDQQQSLSFSHTGIEDAQEPLDVGEIAVALGSYQSIKTVGDLAIIDKRLVMGNISYLDVSNLSEWAAQFKHQVKYKQIDGLGEITNEKIGGYLDPSNVFNYPSLVLNETYRIGVDVVFTDGSVSPTFFVDDIKIDTASINTANPTDNRRVPNGGLPHYALNNNDQDASINVPYLAFSNIDLNYDFNGIPIKNAISTIRFRFAKIKPEVLASGFVVMGISGKDSFGPIYTNGSTNISIEIGPQSNHQCQYLDWTGSYEIASISPPQNQNVKLNGTRFVYPNQYNAERRTGFFYSPEISMGKFDDYQLGASDRINILYPVRRTKINSIEDNYNQERFDITGALVDGPPSGDRMLPSLACELSANPVSTPSQLSLENSDGVNQYDIEDAVLMEAGETTILGGNPSVDVDTFHQEKSSGTGRFSIEEFDIAHSKCLAIRTDSEMFPFQDSYWTSEGVDYGVYYAQIFRDTPNKYQENETTEYQPYSQSYSIDQIQSVETELDVFGGDSFIVKTLVRNRFARLDYSNSDSPTPSGLTSGEVGRQLGMTYFTQTSMNMELVYDNPDFISFPEDFIGTYFERWSRWTDSTGGAYRQFYNTKYSYGLSQLVKNAFSENLNDLIEDVPTRIVWSSRDIYSSVYDSMKTFLPLSIFDLDGTFGAVEAVENVGGELFTLQQRKFQIQAFNARGQLETTANSVDVLLKSGDVLSQDGKTLSSYGTEHKWSAILGKSQSGKDVIYWFNSENGLVMRFGADGTRVISARGMSAYFVNYTKWVKNKHEHAFEQGIRGVWDDRRKEAIWTFYGWRNVKQSWSAGTLVEVGEVVISTNAPFDTYEETPRFFKCIQVHQSSAATEPAVGADWEDYWEAIPYTDPKYYSIFTVAFNELTNGFRCFYGHLPKTYLQWGNTFLSSHPVHRNLIFEHREGLPTTWYGVDSFLTGNIPPKVEDATIEAVINPVPAEKKRYLNGLYVTDIAPYRVEYRTNTQETFDTEAEFVQDENEWKAPIRNDITQTGDPTADGDHMYGGFLKVKYFFEGGKFSTLYNFLVKLYRKARLINR